jgi:hypothetical protein
MGRPRIEFDRKVIEGLASIQCTDEEIAAVLGVSVDTLTRRKKDDPQGQWPSDAARYRRAGR